MRYHSYIQELRTVYESSTSNPTQKEPERSTVNENGIMVCTVCDIDIPARSKHCKYCDSCVALYNSHCSLAGNCIGQTNRKYFWWYLFFQCLNFATICYFLCISIDFDADVKHFVRNSGLKMVYMIALFMVGGVFAAMLVFQTCFAVLGLTCKEFKKKKSCRSEYSRGCIKNLYYFCFLANRGSITEWKSENPAPS